MVDHQIADTVAVPGSVFHRPVGRTAAQRRTPRTAPIDRTDRHVLYHRFTGSATVSYAEIRFAGLSWTIARLLIKTGRGVQP